MARLVFAMNQSLDGYVDHDRFGPSPGLFRHFIDEVSALSGSIYGREMYEVMRYWDRDDATWGPNERAYAEAWRAQPKWVVSTTLTDVGPHATLISDNVVQTVRSLREEMTGEVEVAGPRLAGHLAQASLIDEYRIYLHPVAIGDGKPYFSGPRPAMLVESTQRLAGDVLQLRYVPA